MDTSVGIHNQDPFAPVAITKWEEDGRAVEEALDMSEALKGFDPSMKVFIKPNLVEFLTKVPFPPFGIITTNVVLESLIRYLKDAGARDITIAEAALENQEFGCGTKITYESLGYNNWAKKYGVKLMDLNDQPFQKVSLDGFSLSISTPMLEEAEFLINVPALKTHEQTKITLGFKNNKGCLNTKSKTICHHRKRPLDEFVNRLGERLYPQLTLIDGIYSLENGPMHMGKAYRENLIIASRDMFSADCTGAYLMGFDPAGVDHLKTFAENHDRSMNIDDFSLKGLNPSEYVHHIKNYDDTDPWYTGADVAPKFFEKYGVKGFRVPHPGQTLCTGCSMLLPVAILCINTVSMMSEGKPFDNYELLTGKKAKPSGNAKKTFLLGDCIIAANRKKEGIQEAIEIPGCPASVETLFKVFNENGIPIDGHKALNIYFKRKLESYTKKSELFSMHHFITQEQNE